MADSRPLVGVGIFVCKDGKFLMGQRKGAHGEGSWSVPGGHLEFGESFEETARREVKEETGLDCTNVRFGAVTNDFFTAENKHYMTVWMIADWHHGHPAVMEPDKYVQQQWVDFDSLPEPLFLPWKQLLSSEFLPVIKQAIAATAQV